MEEAKKNKRQGAQANKADPLPGPPPNAESTDLGEGEPRLAAQNGGTMVRVRFRMGRGAEGVVVDAKNEAVVDAGLAAYLISIGYADEVK